MDAVDAKGPKIRKVSVAFPFITQFLDSSINRFFSLSFSHFSLFDHHNAQRYRASLDPCGPPYHSGVIPFPTETRSPQNTYEGEERVRFA